MASLVQIAVCTSNLPRTIRTLVEVFGFASAGGRPRWGAFGARLQELPSGDDTACILWWMLGRQEFAQVELFHHYNPPQRPRPEGWRPSDLGWSRFGIAVSDFDDVLERLSAAGEATLTAPVVVDGARRVCFRESGSDVIIEILEETERDRVPGVRPGPAVTYAAMSVSNLEIARQQIRTILGFEEIAPDALHRPEHEALWGLPGATRECAVFDAVDMLLEVVQYQSPEPRPPAPDALLSDQGFMNVAIGYRERDELLGAREAAESLGVQPTAEMPDESGGFYLRLIDRISVEMLLVPKVVACTSGSNPRSSRHPGACSAGHWPRMLSHVGEEVAQVVLRERQARDRARWEQMRDQYWPDADVRLSWFHGDAHEHIDASRRMSSDGRAAAHRLSPPIVSVREERAIVELPAVIEAPATVREVDVIVSSFVRLQYRVTRRDGAWRIHRLDTIYERDSLSPAVPGDLPSLDPNDLAHVRKPLWLLAWVLNSRGYSVMDDLLGDDEPERIRDFYEQEWQWLAAREGQSKEKR